MKELQNTEQEEINETISLEVSEGRKKETVFSAWARVFYNSKESRKSYQILPTHCPTYMSTRSTYLYLKTEDNFLYLYPDKPEEDREYDPMLKRPIDLKYFNAIRLPGSQTCVALYSKQDERNRSYVFRLEFFNKTVSQPVTRLIQLQRSTALVKRLYSPKYVKSVAKSTAKYFSTYETIKEAQLLEQKKNVEAHTSYFNAVPDMNSDYLNLVT